MGNRMLSEPDIHFISSFFTLAAAFIPIYLSYKIKSKNLRILTVILSIFVVVHGAFHITGTLGLDFLSEDILQPLSFMILIYFGLFYLNLMRKKGKIVRKYE